MHDYVLDLPVGFNRVGMGDPFSRPDVQTATLLTGVLYPEPIAAPGSSKRIVNTKSDQT